MHLRPILAVIMAAGMFAQVLSVQGADKTHRPNIIVLLADDLGYGELGCYGYKDAITPNLDAMAKAGVRCTSGYVTCPVCSPSRAGLLTGKYQQRFGHENNIAQSWELQHPELMGLPVGEKTIADRLKEAGYRTAAIGKWHLGVHENFQPQKRGFDEFFGFLEGGRAYLSDDDPGNFFCKSLPPYQQVHFKEGVHAPIYRGREVVAEKQYLTDAFTREALRFIDASRGQPFFLYLAYNAVHSPITPCARWEAKLSNIENPVRRTLASMTAAMDENIGTLRDHLRALGIAENTLLIFLSDNGGSPGGSPAQVAAGAVSYSLNTPLHGFKGECYEGGIRIPYIVEWPGTIRGGVTSDAAVSSLDILPTTLAAAGAAPAPQTDGVNLLPFFQGAASSPPHEKLFWRFHVYKAARKGSMKLVKQRDKPDELYDLAADVTESKDLAAAKPEVVAELNKELTVWESQMIPPRWSQQFPLRPDGRPLFGSLLQNGNVEEAQPGKPWPKAWYRSKTCVQWSTAKSLSPSHSLCIEDNPAGKQEAGVWRSLAEKTSPGMTYTLTWAWQHTSAKNISAELRFFDAAGKCIARKTTHANGSNDAFEKQTIRAVAPAQAATVDVLFTRAADGSGTVFIDDIHLTDGFSAPTP
jgi:arylsulfatase A-like enzyme